MKKYFLLFSVFFFAVTVVFSQNTPNSASPVPQLDDAVKELAANINKKLTAEKAQKIAVGQISYRGALPSLGTYWINQLSAELANISDRSYTILSGGASGADWTISGEIIDVTGVIRVYTRLIRSEDRAIEGAFLSDFERTTALTAMLAGGESGGSSGSSSLLPDEWEPDSWDNPVPYEIGVDENAQLMNRNLHIGGDEDFFLLIPERDGRLVMETTGRIDTYMEFYDAQTHEMLDEDDDGGQGDNARIRYNVQAGHRYIAKVRGYGRSTTGNYAFRAYMPPPREGANSWESPLSYEIGAHEEVPVMNRVLERGDEDYFLLVPEVDGRLTVETTGDTDTYMEFYDADTQRKLAENDDGGVRYNARIRHNVEAGKRYIAKVYEVDRDAGRYGLRAYIQVQTRIEPDEYEPDDDPSQANLIEIGTPQTHTFHNADDVDWVKFQITQPGRYIIRTRGVNSNRLDTYIELFDSNLNSIAEDDDGGENVDSLLSLNLDSGLYYLKVWCLSDEPDQPYTISITAE